MDGGESKSYKYDELEAEEEFPNPLTSVSAAGATFDREDSSASPRSYDST